MPTRSALTEMRPPFGVNLTALDRRFHKICCRRVASARTLASRDLATTCRMVRSLASAAGRTLSSAASSTGIPATARARPAAFRSSSATCRQGRSRAAPAPARCGRSARAHVVGPSRSSDREQHARPPRITFSGVRSSCDNVARNSSFSRFDSLSPRSVRSCVRSVTTTATVRAPSMFNVMDDSCAGSGRPRRF